MKTLRALALPVLVFGGLSLMLALYGCVTQRECQRREDKVRAEEMYRCDRDLDRVAEECADQTGEDAPESAPIFGRGGFGQ